MTKEQYKERKQDWSEKTDQLNKRDENLANEISKRLMLLGNLIHAFIIGKEQVYSERTLF